MKVSDVLQPFISSFEEVFQSKSLSSVVNLNACDDNEKIFDTIKKSCLG